MCFATCETYNNGCKPNDTKRNTDNTMSRVEKKKRVKSCKKKQVFRHSWTVEEDFKLRMLVEKYHKRHWKLIAQGMQLRILFYDRIGYRPFGN